MGKAWGEGESGMNWQSRTDIYRLLLLLLLLLSRFSHVQLCATPQTAAHQAPLSLGVSRQEHWSGLPYMLPCVKSMASGKLLYGTGSLAQCSVMT